MKYSLRVRFSVLGRVFLIAACAVLLIVVLRLLLDKFGPHILMEGTGQPP